MRQAGIYSGILSRSKSVPHSLPLARIKKIMKKSGDDVKMISGEAPLIFSKACELFIQELTQRSWNFTIQSKRRTLHKDDVASALLQTDVFDFLVCLVDGKTTNYSPSNSSIDHHVPSDDQDDQTFTLS
ncbi:Nuclear transcription factor Y subunit gamma [Euphorbia peplus]|nr:Nuclear transcription factor Y subunit gamma [Euphorbia peplus]